MGSAIAIVCFKGGLEEWCSTFYLNALKETSASLTFHCQNLVIKDLHEV